MTYDPRNYEARQAANDKSRRLAFRDGQPWTVTDDALILEFWVQTPAAERDEAEVARMLERTIEACRNRAHYLAGVHTGVRYNKQHRGEPRRSWMDEWEEETGGRYSG